MQIQRRIKDEILQPPIKAQGIKTKCSMVEAIPLTVLGGV